MFRPVVVAQPLETNGGNALSECSADGLTFPQSTVEADRKTPRRAIRDQARHADDTADVCQERLCLHLAVAGAEHHYLDAGSGSTKCLFERRRRHQPRLALGALEEQAVLLVSIDSVGLTDDIPAEAAGGRRPTDPAMSAKVYDRWLELAELAEQVQRLHSPARNQLELLSVTAALKLLLDRSRFPAERKFGGPKGVGGEEQDGVFRDSLHRRRRWLCRGSIHLRFPVS